MTIKKFIETTAYQYGAFEAEVLIKSTPFIQDLQKMRNKTKVFTGATTQLYGYEYHGNVMTENSERRINMSSYLRLINFHNSRFEISTLALSGPITESKDLNGQYINQNPISEAQAAKEFLENNGANSNAELIALESSHTEGSSMMVEQLFTSIKELRRLGHKNIIVHCRIQDYWRVNRILKEMQKYGEFQTNENTMVYPHGWRLDNGDTKGSALAALFKRGKDTETIKRLL